MVVVVVMQRVLGGHWWWVVDGGGVVVTRVVMLKLLVVLKLTSQLRSATILPLLCRPVMSLQLLVLRQSHFLLTSD